MSYDHKISDLKYRINGLVPVNVCQKIINIFEKYPELNFLENSYKFKTKKNEMDDYKCLNLSRIENPNEDILYALNEAKKYISIMIANYLLHIRSKKISPTFNDNLINSSSNIRILKYGVGESIKDHSDVDHHTRASCTLNLNEDYEGGEFRFFNGQIKEVFKTGDAMLFPAEPIWIHGTEPVIKGTRYSINCFLHPLIKQAVDLEVPKKVGYKPGPNCSEINNMFKYVYYEIDETIINEIIKIIDSYEGINVSNETCTEKGFQTDNILHLFPKKLLKKIIPINKLYKRIFHIHYIKYNKGGYQKEHFHPSDDYSFILYLNNSDGNTVLKNPVNKKFSPKKGKIVIFNGKIVHCGEPSFKEKKILVGAIN
tara:strand:- start:890 stop:1999 length:1110 start_codon:yes stop_codon:yes gene_type:complete